MDSNQNYKEWEISQLKEELQKRNLLTTGVKEILVQRLEDNDKSITTNMDNPVTGKIITAKKKLSTELSSDKKEISSKTPINHKLANKKLRDAIIVGDLEAVIKSYEDGAHVNHIDSNGYTPLYLAVQGGHLNIVEFLISKGAYVNFYERWDPVLMVAVRYPIIFKKLIEAGADVDVQNNMKNTPLSVAVDHDEPKLVRILIDAGADVDPKNIYKITPFMSAIEKDNPNIEIAEMLLEHGANIDHQDINGQTALLRVVLHGTRTGINFLMIHNANPFIRNTRYGRTARDMTGSPEIKSLLEKYEKEWLKRKWSNRLKNEVGGYFSVIPNDILQHFIIESIIE